MADRGPAVAGACAAVTVLLFFVQCRIIAAAANAQYAAEAHWLSGQALSPAFVHALPYPVIDKAFGPPTSAHVALIVLGVVQSVVLWLLVAALRGRTLARAERFGLAAAAAAMAAVALLCPALESFDVYAYAGYAKLGVAASYAPPALPFAGAFADVNRIWGTPLVASYYGPLWVWASGVVAGHAATLGGAILAFRWLELVALAAIVASLALRRAGAPLLAVVALNPAVYGMYVVSAHNDLAGAALVVAALAAVAAAPVGAALLIGCAGLVKLPLTAFALVVFAGRGSLARRAAFVALAIAVVLAGSWLLGGRAYVDDLLFRLHQGNDAGSALHVLTARALRLGLLAAAAIGLLAVFARGIVFRSVSWALITLSSLVYPWYLAWSLPYAALARPALAQLAILLPLAAALLDPAFSPLGLGQLATALMLAYAAYELLRARRRALPVD